MLPLLLLLGCGPPVLDPGGPVIDIHAHCFADSCDPKPGEVALGGELTVAALSLQHYAIADALGDPIPEEGRFFETNNEAVRSMADSEQVIWFASLPCLSEVPASDPGWLDRCLADADALLAAGASGFKDHAGKTWDREADLGLWVGAWNRLAGWCLPPADEEAPNAWCVDQPDLRYPLADPSWRELVRGLVEERGVPLVTHATPWREAGTFEPAVAALLDFAAWAEVELTDEARRRVVVAHQGFLDGDPRLERLLDAGLSIDTAQTALASAGPSLGELIADHPDQVVFGTDVELGRWCMERHYDAWMWGLMGEAGKTRRYRKTCRDTMKPVGAGLSPNLARRVLHDNAAEITGL